MGTPEELIDGRIAPCHHAIAKTTTTICSMEHVSKVSRQFSLLKQLAERITQLPATEETSEIVSIIQRVQTSPLLNPPLKDMLQPQDILAHDLNKLLLSSASSDVVFVVDGEEIPAHKLVLTTRLPYFEQLFSSGMREAVSNRVTIEDVDAATFKQLLRYVYCGQLPDDMDKSPERFLPSAEKYDMKEIKVVCVSSMIKNIKVKTSWTTYSRRIFFNASI